MSVYECRRREVVDGALGLLEAHHVPDLVRHLEECRSCRAEHDRVHEALSGASRLPAAEPPVALDTLVARVRAEIDRRDARPRRWPAGARRVLGPAFATAAAVMLMIAVQAPRERASVPPSGTRLMVSEGVLRQMERTVNREQTARYLEDAQDVLVSVTASLPRCERGEDGRRAVGPEASRSRDLLARRRLLVDTEAETLASARPVLEDVDRTLSDVAALDGCSDPAELRAIARRITEERLLMKIGLMARELQG